MASASPRDPIYGQPYTGTPVLASTSRTESGATVLDMYRKVLVVANISDSDDNYTADGDLYHE